MLEADASERALARGARRRGLRRDPASGLARQRRAERRPERRSPRSGDATPSAISTTGRAGSSGSRLTTEDRDGARPRDPHRGRGGRRRPRDADARQPGAARRRLRPSSRSRSARGALAAAEGAVRPARHSQSGADGGGRLMQNLFLPRPARRPEHRGGGFDPAALRALRLLPRHLPDLSGARQRARFAARTNLPDQGHAGERQAGIDGGRAAYRPLPLLPLLHDDLPLGRRLHAPRRPGARPHREDLPRPFARPARAQACSHACCPTAAASASRCCWRGSAAPSSPLLERFGPAGARLAAMLALAPGNAAARRPAYGPA